MVKLEEEAAGIALATEEEYTQYQQLKQVQLLVSVPWIFLEVDTSSVRWYSMCIDIICQVRHSVKAQSSQESNC